MGTLLYSFFSRGGTHRRLGVDALYAPRRVLLDRVLVDAAARGGAEFLFHSKATTLARNADGRVSGLDVETPQGSLTVNARLVIGADGLHSSIARQVGASDIVTGRHATAVLYSYWKGVPSVGYEWHYAPHGSVGAIPTNDGAERLERSGAQRVPDALVVG